jgi:kynurenine formamidase
MATNATLSGALRHIDSTATARGLAAVTEFRSVSLGLPIAHGKGPVAPLRTPTQHFMRRDGGDYATGARSETGGFGFSDDVIMMSTHGTTHVDALCHVFCGGMMFGGIPASEVSSFGARQLGAETLPPIATRAIVVDAVPPGRDWLDPGEKIPAVRLQELIAEAGLQIEPGDAVIVRTGSVRAFRAGEDHSRAWPGLAVDCIDWVRESGIALLGADNMAVEAVPSGDPNNATPLHVALVHGEGVLFVELLDLEEVAGRTFAALFVLSPLRIVGGTASPVAPTLVL